MEQLILVIVNKLLLEGAVEAFDMGVHFGRAGIGPPMGDAVFFQLYVEVAHERRAVVFDPEVWGFWQELTQRVEGDGGLAAGLGGSGKGDGEAALGVDEGEQVTAQSIA